MAKPVMSSEHKTMLDHQTAAPAPISPLVLADRLISLAQDADRAGFSDSANRLVGLAYAVLEERPHPPH
jgi:hypothetical protein